MQAIKRTTCQGGHSGPLADDQGKRSASLYDAGLERRQAQLIPVHRLDPIQF